MGQIEFEIMRLTISDNKGFAVCTCSKLYFFRGYMDIRRQYSPKFTVADDIVMTMFFLDKPQSLGSLIKIEEIPVIKIFIIPSR